MINELLEITNSEEFYQNSWFNLVSVNHQAGNQSLSEFDFILDDRDEMGAQINLQYWKIKAFKTLEINNLVLDTLLPYIKLKILEEHPLLWKYNKSELECELKNFPEKINEFVGELYFEIEKVTGNWIAFDKIIYGLQQYSKGIAILNFPEPLKVIFESICSKYNIDFSIINTIEGYKKGYADRPNAKLLIFGNEDVNPNESNLYQPYMIADNFSATVV